jgi:hypothetical protein
MEERDNLSKGTITMEENKKSYLLGLVQKCLDGVYRWDDATWSFILHITNDNDASLFEVAPQEIKDEILKIHQYLEANGNYRMHVSGGADVDHTDRLIKFFTILRNAGYGVQ